jgi:hypothetical protein
MKNFIWVFGFIFLANTPLFSAAQDNILFYKDQVQVTAEISPYDKIKENYPIPGTLMITHNDNLKVDPSSVRMGKDSLQVKLLKEVPMSSDKLIISIYEFKIEGKRKGNYTLDPITVKVGGKEYEAPPLIIDIGM